MSLQYNESLAHSVVYMSTWVIFGYNISIMCSKKYTENVATISRTVLHSL